MIEELVSMFIMLGMDLGIIVAISLILINRDIDRQLNYGR
jgi:hypothetical protein